jgi:hypothetical protein
VSAREKLIARQDMARQHAAERPARILRALAGHPAGLTTTQLTGILGEPRTTAVLTWYGQILRTQEKAGRVARPRQTAGAWQQAPAFIWELTTQGAGRVREIDGAIRAADEAMAAYPAAVAAAAGRGRRLADARASYGRETPRIVRQQVARELRELGCTLDEVGPVFGVSREAIRKDLAWDGITRKPGRKPRPRPVLLAEQEVA